MSRVLYVTILVLVYRTRSWAAYPPGTATIVQSVFRMILFLFFSLTSTKNSCDLFGAVS